MELHVHPELWRDGVLQPRQRRQGRHHRQPPHRHVDAVEGRTLASREHGPHVAGGRDGERERDDGEDEEEGRGWYLSVHGDLCFLDALCLAVLGDHTSKLI